MLTLSPNWTPDRQQWPPKASPSGATVVGLAAGSYQLSEVKKLRALKRSDALLKKSLRKVKASENSALLMRCAPVEDTVQRIAAT
jgi:hypothetical protein